MKESASNKKNKIAHSAKECAYLAVFVALVIAVQVVFSAVPGVELVTVMFVTYAFTFGVKRGMISATVFSLLRQFVFGGYPNVLILYLVYFNLLTVCFGLLGKVIKNPLKGIVGIVIIACACTVCFTLLDDIITPLWYGYSEQATRIYFKASLLVLIPQAICTAVSVGVLFLPLQKAFAFVKNRLS